MEGVVLEDCPGIWLPSGGLGGSTEGDIVPVPRELYGGCEPQPEVVELCGSEW